MGKTKDILKTPLLRSARFTNAWLTAKLEDICDQKISYGIVQAGPNYPGGMPYIKSTDLNSRLSLEKLDQTSPDIAKKYSRSEVYPNDIVFSLRGNIAATQIVPASIPVANLTQGTARISVSKQFNTIFVQQSLRATKTKRQVDRRVKGSTLREISLTDLRTVEINYPELEEQAFIAESCSAADTKIQQLEKKKTLWEQYKKGCMQQIFTQQIRFKADDGSDFPDWAQIPIGRVFEEVLEKVEQQNFPTFSISAGVGWVSQAEKFGRDISGSQNSKYTALKPNEFSYNKGNSKLFPYGCVYPNRTGKTIAVPNVFISFRLRRPTSSVGYFAKLFESHFLDRGLRKLISSGARMDGLLNVNKVSFFELMIPTPSDSEQRKIADFLASIDDKLDLIEQELTQAKAFKKGLLQQMFV